MLDVGHCKEKDGGGIARASGYATRVGIDVVVKSPGFRLRISSFSKLVYSLIFYVFFFFLLSS